MNKQEINEYRVRLLLDAVGWLSSAAQMIENEDYNNVPVSVWGHMAVAQNVIKKCFETIGQEDEE